MLHKISKVSSAKEQFSPKFPKVRYFDISWLSHYDGPGQRVVVFLQGCHLRCPWCHSPHSQASEAPLLFSRTRCSLCRCCEKVCAQSVHRISGERHDLYRKNCIHCGKCIDACPVSDPRRFGGALYLPTKEISVDELWELIYPQVNILRKIGGITFSGGEALLQVHALKQLLLLCKEKGIHTAIETSGTLPVHYISEVIDLVDCWLFGLRPTPFYIPPDVHLIDDNLAFLSEKSGRVIVRTPIIKGITDLSESLEGIALYMQTYQLSQIQLLPFNRGTPHYYDASGTTCPIGSEAIPSKERLDYVKDYFQRKGFMATITN